MTYQTFLNYFTLYCLTDVILTDDVTLSLCGRCPELLIQIANNELHKFHTWCLANRLTVNTLKTFYMIFCNTPPKKLSPLVIKSNKNYSPIKKVDQIKFLGIYYDCKMTFKPHINNLSNRLSRIAALLFRVKNFMPEFVLKRIYHAHVSSIINYCNIIWANTYPSHLDPLVKAQKRIIRLITNSEFLAHTQPLFQQLKIFDIENLRKYSLAIYFFKNLNSLLPNLQAHHNYQTRFRNRPRPIRHLKSIFKRSFIYQAPIVWNELMDGDQTFNPNSINLPMFKRLIKHQLITS